MGFEGARGVLAPPGPLNRGSQPFNQRGSIPSESTLPSSASLPTENVSLPRELQRRGLLGIQAPSLPGAPGRSAASMMSSVATPATNNPADIPGHVAGSNVTNARHGDVERSFQLSDEIIRQAMMRDDSNRRR